MKYDFFQNPRRQLRFWRDYFRFSRLAGERPPLKKLYPILNEADRSAGDLGVYFYQAVWATQQIATARPGRHVDVGSHLFYVGILSTVVPVTFVDIRPVRLDLPGFMFQQGSLLELPFPDKGLASVSCLHVVEHVGLGRYGDPINPDGTRLALSELTRVLAPGGILYLSAPIGRPHIRFNAHRVLAASWILEWCRPLELVAFAAVDARGVYHPVAAVRDYDDAPESYGFFRLTRPTAG